MAEDTQAVEEARIQNEIQKAEAADEAAVIPEPNADPDFHQTAMRVLSAGYSYIYDPKTGDRSKALNYMLPSLLRIRNEDGSPRFTTIKPPFEPPKGIWKCLLHKDSPNRKLYDEMGFAVCPAGNLANRYQRDRHMQRKHKTEYAAILEMQRQERDEADRKARSEDREFQKMLMERLAGQAVEEKPPLYVSKKDREKQNKG